MGLRLSARLLVSAATAVMLVGIATPTEGGVAAAAGSAAGPAVGSAAFTCTTPTIFDASGSPTELQEQFQGAGSPVFVSIGSNSAWRYNAVGYDVADNLLYAVSSNGSPNGIVGHLISIDATGTITDLGPLSGVPADDLAAGMNVGFFDNSGHFWIASVPHSGILFQVDLATGVATPLAGQTVNIASNDLTVTPDGLAWGVRNAIGDGVSAIVRVDLSTGAVTFFTQGADGLPVSDLIPVGKLVTDPNGDGQFGAAWTYGNGNLGFDSNAGAVYEVALAGSPAGSGAGGPTFSLVSKEAGPASSNNDGASCSNPANLSVAKTASTVAATAGATVGAGATVTWKLTVTNSGPGVSSGFVLDDSVPAAYSNVTVLGSTVPGATAANGYGCVVTGNAVQCIDGFGSAGLAPGATATVTLSATAPASGCLTNVADVIGNEQTGGVQVSNPATTCVTTTPVTTPPPSSGVDAIATSSSAPPTPAPTTAVPAHASSGLAFTGVRGLGWLLGVGLGALVVGFGLTLAGVLRRTGRRGPQ